MALEKAVITNTETNEKIQVLFNPEEYTVNKDINYAQAGVPGLSGPILQFVAGNMSTLELELLVDTHEAHQEGAVKTQADEDVRNLTGKIVGLMTIDSNSHAPPVLIFSWGSLSFTCVLARCSQRFIMFRPDGIPVRARLTVTFNEYLDPEREAKAINRQTADFSKEVIVGQGATLSGIAADTYGDAALWRPIAIANGIDDPRALAAGRRLRIPSLPFTDPESGERYG
jgi:hypothetical protein